MQTIEQHIENDVEGALATTQTQISCYNQRPDLCDDSILEAAERRLDYINKNFKLVRL